MTAEKPEELPTTIACALAEGCTFSGTWPDYLAHAPEHDLPHPDDRDRWLPARRTFIGASEVAAICGVNPYDSALDVWAAKVRGREKRKKNLEGRATARLGHLMEPELLRDYAEQRGVEIYRPASKRHPLYPWAAATPDGVASSGELVQVKMVGANMLHHWSDGPPWPVLLQVQWELFVWERERVVIRAGLGGTDIEDYPVERDDETIESVRQMVELFWTDAIVPRVLPSGFDGETSEATLQMLFPRARGPMAKATPEIIGLVLQYIEAREAEKAGAAAKNAVGARLQQAIGELEGFEWPKGKVTWRNASGGLDKEALAQSLLETFIPGERERQAWIDRFTLPTGSRRLYVAVKK